MSISNLFHPNDYELFSSVGVVPGMSVVSTPNVTITLNSGAITAGSVRGNPMTITSGQGSFGASTCDTMIVESSDKRLIQCTIHIPQFTLTTLTGTPSTITLALNLPPTIAPAQDISTGCIMAINATPDYSAIICGVTRGGQFLLRFANSSFASGAGLPADLCFVYTLSLTP